MSTAVASFPTTDYTTSTTVQLAGHAFFFLGRSLKKPNKQEESIFCRVPQITFTITDFLQGFTYPRPLNTFSEARDSDLLQKQPWRLKWKHYHLKTCEYISILYLLLKYIMNHYFHLATFDTNIHIGSSGTLDGYVSGPPTWILEFVHVRFFNHTVRFHNHLYPNSSLRYKTEKPPVLELRLVEKMIAQLLFREFVLFRW